METSQAAGEGVRRRILVVDDDASVRMLLMAALRRGREYDVFEADDGSAARAMLQQEQFDVVITDLVMPNMDGLSLLKWGQQNVPGVAWVILSGRATFDDAVKAVRLGAFDFITKPLAVLDQLLVTVRNAIRQRELMAEHERLDRQLEERNTQLGDQVSQLRGACRILCDQAHCLSEDLRRAELIQRAMLPQRPPETPGYAINAIYRPSAKVGGDLYDVSRIGHHLVAYVADAAGHGVSAAMLAVLFKHRLHLVNEETSEPTEPAEVLRRVNAALIEECSRPGLFITAAFCVLDLETGKLTISSAGHPPILLHRADGEMEMAFHTGPALGTHRDPSFIQTRTELRRGDRILLYTDGLFDAGDESRALNHDALSSLLVKNHLPGQAQLHDLLAVASDRRDQSPQEDDITMVMITAADLPSALDNGTASPIEARPPATVQAESEVLIGKTANQTGVRVSGRGIWTSCPAFHDICLSEIDKKHDLLLDLSRCEYLDSTFLGTIQEVSDHADQCHTTFHIQGIRPEVRHLFDELGMDQVVRHFSVGLSPLPDRMIPLEIGDGDDERYRRNMLEAHEVLAAMNERNRREFYKLIEGIRRDVEHAKSR